MLAVLDARGGEPAVVSFDGDRNALLQTVAIDDDGAVWAGGTEGWVQNPVGVSVAGPGRPLVLHWAGAPGSVPVRVDAPTLRGHAELRALAYTDHTLLLGGVEDGPVTHTWDGNREALRSDGWIRVGPTPSRPSR